MVVVLVRSSVVSAPLGDVLAPAEDFPRLGARQLHPKCHLHPKFIHWYVSCLLHPYKSQGKERRKLVCE